MSDQTPSLDEIRARRAAITQGPWKVYAVPLRLTEEGRREFGDVTPPPEYRIGTAYDHPQLHAPVPVVTTAWRPYCVTPEGVGIAQDDAEFIAHAPSDIDALLSRVEADERRMAELDEERERLDWLRNASASVHCNYTAGDEAWSVTIDRFDSPDDLVFLGPSPREAIDKARAATAAPPVDLDAVCDPDFTGGLDPVTYLDKLHNGEL